MSESNNPVATTNWFTRNCVGRGKILIVEDDLDLLSTLKEFLTTQGYDVSTASDGAEGVRAILKNEFRAIVCDMQMPKFPGDMFYVATGRVKPHLCERFVFITGDSSSSRIKRFIKSMDGILLYKPFPLYDLLSAIHTVEERSGANATMALLVANREFKHRGDSSRELTGIIRSVDLDQGSFKLRIDENGRRSIVACAFEEPLEAVVISLLNKRARVTSDQPRPAHGETMRVSDLEAVDEPLIIEHVA